ncbi:hypothetical protein S7711_00483 [Stachybotrys chartarum IBT 7711]|uniref:Vacuolar protein-sorting-associated protein 36 n=1 Tax=Stachybotrys chartarum (strain CBS 109288 / IBT 7711) TaxID=1280523 RepID=A0A084B9U8_STACB|nr:hypothetical protein S7711_00483 [Stachybotrys chartarum IBT 7711]KFA53392.1 hypothetical protein S40293_03408 [Stachybotrys chartarum IBT 40293]
MFLKHIDLTTALRPSYLPDEVLLFVQDNVGLYEGKFKLPNQQNGQVYLTSHRICYVDKAEPRANSVALDLKDVDRFESYGGFLKSSPKITLIPKPLRQSGLRHRASSSTTAITRDSSSSPIHGDSVSRPPPSIPTTATWLCTICSFSNPVPSNFDPTAANAHTPLPPCLACGIKPTLAHMLKAAITSANNHASPLTGSDPSTSLPLHLRTSLPRPLSENLDSRSFSSPRNTSGNSVETNESFQCPRCTFSNHPSLLSCEMCGAPLLSKSSSPLSSSLAPEQSRTMSPGPISSRGKQLDQSGIDVADSVKISFRTGGVQIFHERLKGAMTQRKWLLQNAPPAPKSGRLLDNGAGSRSPDGSTSRTAKTAGIAGLEQLGKNMRKNNELLIGSAFEDLEALMASAKDVIALAESFARQRNGGAGISAEENALLAESANQLGLVATKDIVGGGGGSETLYLSELCRNMAEFLTDDARGVLKKAGGIITLVDLWAMFNRARGGVELVSPMDFEKAARMWESLKLPVRLRTFRSGVMVVQGRDRTDETTIKALSSWLQDLHEFPPERDVPWDWHKFGRGVTAQEAAERFGWSLGVAEEELLMAEEHGALCREEGIEGLKFWKNYIDTGDTPRLPKKRSPDDEVLRALTEAGFL